MTIHIKLYGTLGKHVEGYQSKTGMICTFEENETLTNLVQRIGIPLDKIGIITINGDMAKAYTKVPDQCQIKIFQPIFGG